MAIRIVNLNIGQNGIIEGIRPGGGVWIDDVPQQIAVGDNINQFQPHLRVENGVIDVPRNQVFIENQFLNLDIEAAPVIQPLRWDNAFFEAGAAALDEAMFLPEGVAARRGPKEPQEKNGPLLWDKLLNAVDEIFEPSMSCVAGGAVRDYLVGVDPKDIDIWINPRDAMMKREFLLDEIQELGQCLGWKSFELKGRPVGYNKDEIECVFQGEVFGHTIDVVFTSAVNPREVMDMFDFYINQHWYQHDVNSTPAAKVDLQKKVWRMLKGKKLGAVEREHFLRVNKRCKGIYKLDEGEPWYAAFAGKEKIK